MKCIARVRPEPPVGLARRARTIYMVSRPWLAKLEVSGGDGLICDSKREPEIVLRAANQLKGRLNCSDGCVGVMRP